MQEIKVNGSAYRVGKFYPIDPGNPKYTGVYFRYTSKGVKNFYVQFSYGNRQKKVHCGNEHQGITKTWLANRRTELIQEAKHSGSQLLPAPTLNKAFAKFIEIGEAEGKTVTKNERYRYDKHIKPHIGHLKLDRITAPMIENLKPKWTKAGLSPASLKFNLSLISRSYKIARSVGMYSGPNPMPDVKKIRGTKTQRIRWFTHEEYSTLSTYIRSRDKFLWRQMSFAALAGLRRIEVDSIRISDIDLENNLLKIGTRKTVNRTEKFRFVPIQSKLRQIIEEMLSETEYKSKDKLFYRRVNYEKFKMHVDELGFNDGIDKKDTANTAVFHTLRHSFASWLAIEGTEIDVIGGLLGHSNLNATQIYMHLAPNRKTRAMEKLAEALDNVDIGTPDLKLVVNK